MGQVEAGYFPLRGPGRQAVAAVIVGRRAPEIRQRYALEKLFAGIAIRNKAAVHF